MSPFDPVEKYDRNCAASTIRTGRRRSSNLLIEKTRRLAHGFRNFHHYRLRILLAAGGTRRYRRAPIHA